MLLYVLDKFLWTCTCKKSMVTVLLNNEIVCLKTVVIHLSKYTFLWELYNEDFKNK